MSDNNVLAQIASINVEASSKSAEQLTPLQNLQTNSKTGVIEAINEVNSLAKAAQESADAAQDTVDNLPPSSGGDLIDDSITSDEKTWSSEKIEIELTELGESIVSTASSSYNTLKKIEDIIVSIESDVSTNTSDIATNASDINQNASDISALAASITGFSTGISTNASNITALDGRLTSAESDISTNASDISDNTSAIATNTSHRGLTNNPHNTNLSNLGNGTFAQLNSLVTDATLLKSGDAISALTNDSGYITDYTVTEGDVTAHQAALAISSSQVNYNSNISTTGTVTLTTGDLFLDNGAIEISTGGIVANGEISTNDALVAGTQVQIPASAQGLRFTGLGLLHGIDIDTAGSNDMEFTVNGVNTLSSSGTVITSNVIHNFDAGISVIGNIAVTGTVDGRDIAADGSQLDSNTVAIALNTAKVSADGAISTHSDVDTTGATDGQVLTWVSASSEWQPTTVSGGGSGDEWGDAVDADIIADVDGTRNIGSNLVRFSNGWFDTLTISDLEIEGDAALGNGELDATGATFINDGGNISTGFFSASSTATFGSDIIVSGLVDGRDIASDGADLDQALLDIVDNENANNSLSLIVSFNSGEISGLQSDLSTHRADIGDHTNVNIVSESENHVLIYDPGAKGNDWVNSLLDLDLLDNTNISSPGFGDILAYNSISSKWENYAFNIGDLADVSITSPVSTSVLYYNGSQWIDYDLPNYFRNFSVTGDTTIVPDFLGDTFQFNPGDGIEMDSSGDTLTINSVYSVQKHTADISPTQSILNTNVDVTFNTSSINNSDVSHSGTTSTINNDGMYRIMFRLRCITDNRAELIAQLKLNDVLMTDEIASNYAARDTDQNTGSVTLMTILELTDGDTIKYNASADTDGTFCTVTTGTQFTIERMT